MKREFSVRFFSVAFVIIFVSVFLGVNNFLRHSFYGNRIEKISINGSEFRVEKVSNDHKLQKGLGKRKWICSRCGMIFHFDESKKHSFWMKDTEFPLDIIWISGGEIVSIQKNVSHLDQSTVYTPSEDSDMVLELRSGSCDEYGIKEGDYVRVEN